MMAMAQWATARWDMTTTMMATGDDDDDEDEDNDGDGTMGDEVDDDGDGNDYGDRQWRRRWQRRNGQWRDGIG